MPVLLMVLRKRGLRSRHPAQEDARAPPASPSPQSHGSSLRRARCRLHHTERPPEHPAALLERVRVTTDSATGQGCHHSPAARSPAALAEQWKAADWREQRLHPPCWEWGPHAGPRWGAPAAHPYAPQRYPKWHARPVPPPHRPHPTESPSRGPETVPTSDADARVGLPSLDLPRSVPPHDRGYSAHSHGRPAT